MRTTSSEFHTNQSSCDATAPEPNGDGNLTTQRAQDGRSCGLAATLRLIARALGSVRSFGRSRLRNGLQFTRRRGVEVIERHLELVVGELRSHIPLSQLGWEVAGYAFTIGTIDRFVIAFEVLAQVLFTRLLSRCCQRTWLISKDEVGDDPFLLNRAPFGGVVASDGQFEPGAILELDDCLDRTLSKGRGSLNHCSAVVLK